MKAYLAFENLFLCLIFLSAVLAAQDAPKSIALTDKSDIPADTVSQTLRTECPTVSIVKDASKSDYTLEAIRIEVSHGVGIMPDESFKLTVIDRGGETSRTISSASLATAVKDLCRAVKTFVMVEVVDTTNLTQSSDTRNSGGLIPAVTGRRTHTDTASVRVIINGENVLLDCHEHRKGCGTIGPGKYFGERDGDGIWVNYQVPVTHKLVRDHYKIAGSW
jgi:hypothetical protein